MKPIRQPDNKLTLYISSALLAGLAATVAYWLLSQLDQIGVLAGSAAVHGGPYSADYASVRLFVWVALSADLGAAGLLALWLRAELKRPLDPLAGLSDADMALDPGASRADEASQAALARRMQEMSESLAALLLKVRTTPAPMTGSAGRPDGAGRAAQAPRVGSERGPERRRPVPAIHLISNNPNPVPSQRTERRAPMQMVTAPPAPARPAMPVHAWAAARQDISWEES